ncbi:hypothetical protein [Peribacillus simplex]
MLQAPKRDPSEENNQHYSMRQLGELTKELFETIISTTIMILY